MLFCSPLFLRHLVIQRPMFTDDNHALTANTRTAAAVQCASLAKYAKTPCI